LVEHRTENPGVGGSIPSLPTIFFQSADLPVEQPTKFELVINRKTAKGLGMYRRAFITGVGSLAISPVASRAQQAAAVRRIGYIANAPRTPVTDSFWAAFVGGLQEHGWIESQNLVIERRYVEMRKETALAAAEELVRRRVEVIVVSTTQAALAAKQVTRTVPIVMTVPADPVAVGLVASLARPGGNVTGLSFVGTELAGKQVELLKEAVTGLSSVAVLANPQNASHAPRAKEVVVAARALGLHVDVVEATSRDELVDAVRGVVKRGLGAAVVLTDALFVREANSFVRLVAEQRLPVMYGLREYPLAGGLMSYGASFSDLFRRAGGYVDRILRGAHPSDLPIEQASRFELVINLKTAKALGLTIPPSLLLRADQVIE
jgi:putative ABC transport system substrate-binding protein